MTSPTTMTRVLRPSVRQRARATMSVVTPLAWGCLVVGLVASAAGRRLGWTELTVSGVAALAVLVVSVAFTIGRSTLLVRVDVRPERVAAGGRAAAAVTVSSATGARMLGADMELTVGEGVAAFRVPGLAGDASHEEVFILPTFRRAIIPVGPATSVRGDPLGLLRRVKSWTEPRPLFVHPRTVSLNELGSGFVRDLEGKATTDVSPADVAFSTLREYEPGDDRRFVHWMTSARVGRLMVRQFVDTRRTHVGVAIDGRSASYGDWGSDGTSDELETAISAAASLGVRVLREEQDLSMVAARTRVPSMTGRALLDHLAGIDTEDRPQGLSAEVDLLVRATGGLSLALLVTGSQATIAEMRAASSRLSPDVRVLICRVDPAADTGFRPLGDHLLLTLGDLDDLPRLLWTVAS